MISKVWKNGVFIEEEVEPIQEPIVDEPITFNSKAELEQFIADYIINFLTEGESNG